ncbi:dihydroorotase [Iodidimonas nitroreducens]|uniref:Dihydroorotase n=1 Tax=Iodidimonas nitroreducens TaxID=1236968 RepID=A0A5A7NCP7_9PROT|nr:dihydroorotase [Iodidimonas nitroreducens]GAK33886.1 dihydroorotase [alpha proteobacterium Q-1]GER05250.1 dihydroorotase [Iodidimonas nitroreducens]
MQTAYLNARLIDPASGLDVQGGLLVDDGLIQSLGAEITTAPDGYETIDCKGHVLAPGLIDLCSFRADSAAAAAGGITTVVLMPDQSPPHDDAAMIATNARPYPKKGEGVRILPIGAATQGLRGEAMAEIGLMADAGAVGFSNGRRALGDSAIMRRLLEYSALFDRMILHHAEDPGLAANGMMNEGETATRLGLQGIPVEAEVMMIERDARLVDISGGRLHHLQISTAESLEAIQRNRAQGRRMSCGTSPQYFLLNELAVTDYRTFAKMSPPLRSENDRAAMVAGLKAGLIDVICSGHDPHDQESKRLPFAEAAFGMVGYQTLLPLSLMLYHAYDLPLIHVLAMLSYHPAKLLGLPGGRLAPGAPADLVLFDLDKPWRIDPGDFLSDTQNTPFEGQPVEGKVLRTIVGGHDVFVEGTP